MITRIHERLRRTQLAFAGGVALAVLAQLLSCSSSTSGTSGGSTGGSSSQGGSGTVDSGSSPAPNVIGAFSIDLVPQVPASGTTPEVAAHTLVIGRVDDGTQPQLITWNVSLSGGGCKLLVPTAPFCDPACASGEVCSGTPAQCRNYPNAVSVGSVSLTGLLTTTGPATLTMDPIQNQYQLAGASLAYPPFAEGDKVQLTTSGGDLDAFAIESQGIAPIELTVGNEIAMQSGKSIPLTWVAAGPSSTSRIQVIVDISHHGGQKGEIDCDVPDTGSMEIPANLVTELLALGTAGFPGLQVIRIASGSKMLAQGLVQLNIQSSASRSITIPGLVSCTLDADCPSGQSCQSDSTCQ